MLPLPMLAGETGRVFEMLGWQVARQQGSHIIGRNLLHFGTAADAQGDLA